MKHVLICGEEGTHALAIALHELGVRVTTMPTADSLPSFLEGDAKLLAVIATPESFLEGGALAHTTLRRIAIAELSKVQQVCSLLGGAIDDCLVRPIRPEELLLALHRPAPIQRTKAPNRTCVIGKNTGLAKAWKILEKAAGFDTDILITGESGTGKEIFARAFHAKSKRCQAPFVAVNCAAIPMGLLESQLFGHREGAFTDAHQDKEGVFQQANGGTLFLDEVGDFPLQLQVKLLRALQTGEIQPLGSEETIQVNLRLISATSRDLDAMVCAKTFRDDLFYRLAVIPIHLPPLRERRQDIPLFIQHFLKQFADKHKSSTVVLTANAKELLIQASWPGNVRQLQNAIERLVVLTEAPEIDVDLVQLEIGKEVEEQSSGGTISTEKGRRTLRGRTLKAAMHEVEAQFIAEALDACSGKRARCAELLSISPRALLYKIKEHEL